MYGSYLSYVLTYITEGKFGHSKVRSTQPLKLKTNLSCSGHTCVILDGGQVTGWYRQTLPTPPQRLPQLEGRVHEQERTQLRSVRAPGPEATD